MARRVGAADVVLHALHVVVDHVLRQAERLEEVGQQLVAAGDVARERLARRGQREAAVTFVLEQSFRVEALDHVGHARLADFQAGGDVHDARITLGIDEFENLLQIILHGGRRSRGDGRGRMLARSHVDGSI